MGMTVSAIRPDVTAQYYSQIGKTDDGTFMYFRGLMMPYNS